VARFLGNLFQKLWQENREAPALGQLLGRINSIIVPHPEFERISMQCVELDCRRGLIYIANAGHPDLVLYSKRRRACDVLRVPGDLLHDPHRQTGRFCVYEQYTAEIAPGDILVMFSDGLTEAHRLAGDPYGYRFMKVIAENADRPVKEIGDAILLDWRAQERDQAEVDDVTLVLFRVPGEPRAEPGASHAH
jgi:sigma-B regulation protein RsbU (phosphoserine phosphatase)